MEDPWGSDGGSMGQRWGIYGAAMGDLWGSDGDLWGSDGDLWGSPIPVWVEGRRSGPESAAAAQLRLHCAGEL